MKKGTLLVLLTFALSLLGGCASYKASQAPTLDRDIQAARAVVQTEHLSMMARPIHQEDELKVYFDTDLVYWKVLPIQVQLENASAAQEIEFKLDGLKLLDADSQQRPLLDVDEVVSRAGRSYARTLGWGVAFGLIGAGVSAYQVTEANKAMRADFSRRILQEVRLKPGEKIEGIAFFSVPGKLQSLDGWKLALLANDDDGQEVILNYSLGGEVAVRQNDAEENSQPAVY
jgi:hypothetical protein